jgi:hypothetical protein
MMARARRRCAVEAPATSQTSGGMATRE